MKTKLTATILLAALLITGTAFTQSFSNKGTDFWICYRNHVKMFNSVLAETMQLYITSEVSTTGQIDTASIGLSQSFNVSSNKVTTASIPCAAAPQSSFTVQGDKEQCSNKDITIINNSTVDFGKIVKLEVYWDYSNDPTNKTIDDNPKPGKSYTTHYPEFYTPATKSYTIQVVAYSGENCLSSTSQTITLKAIPQLQLNSVTSICADAAPFQLAGGNTINGMEGSAIFSGKGVSSIGILNPAAAGVGLDTVQYTFTASNTCSNSIYALIQVYALPIVDAGPDKVLLEGEYVTLSGSGLGNNLSFLWTPDSALNYDTIPQPNASPKGNMIYKLTVTTKDGCKASDEVLVKVVKKASIPNVFSPNGDGIHDQWILTNLDSYLGLTVEIYNRYGQLVFKSFGYDKPWDGTYKGQPLPIGTYYYIIDAKNSRQKMTGFVDIIR